MLHTLALFRHGRHFLPQFFPEPAIPLSLDFTASICLHDPRQMPGAILVTSRSGHRGYSGRDMAILEILQPHLSNHLQLLARSMSPGSPPGAEALLAVCYDLNLTRREAEVAILLCRKLTTEAIAARLAISPLTVYKHTEHIYGKLGIGSRRELAGKILWRLPPDEGLPEETPC